MSSNYLETDHITSPADEIFCKGKLLPLPYPRASKWSRSSSRTAPTPTTQKPITHSIITLTATPSQALCFESCNILPATSCYVSGQLNPEDYYFYECPKEFVESHTKKSWSKKLKLIKQYSSLGLKLKASKAYLQSLFTKSACLDETAAVTKAKECSKGYSKSERKNPFGQIQRATSFSRRMVRKWLKINVAIGGPFLGPVRGDLPTNPLRLLRRALPQILPRFRA